MRPALFVVCLCIAAGAGVRVDATTYSCLVDEDGTAATDCVVATCTEPPPGNRTNSLTYSPMIIPTSYAVGNKIHYHCTDLDQCLSGSRHAMCQAGDPQWELETSEPPVCQDTCDGNNHCTKASLEAAFAIMSQKDSSLPEYHTFEEKIDEAGPDPASPLIPHGATIVIEVATDD